MKIKLTWLAISLLIITSVQGIMSGCGSANKISIISLSIIPEKAGIGQEVKIVAVLSNSAQTEAKYSAVLKIDKKLIENKELTVNAGETKNVVFSYTPDSEGIFKVDFNGMAGNLTVVKAPEFQVYSLVM
jgi:hypothetical protein